MARPAAATTHADLVDPITKDELVDPVLASDGHTYSAEVLLHAMAVDPLHRSPMTREVLRPLAFPNPPVCAALGQQVRTTPLVLFTPIRPDDDHARTVAWTVPALDDVDMSLLRRRFGLPDARAFTVTCRVGVSRGRLVLHGYPASAAAEEAVLDMAAALGVCASNPACLAGAALRVHAPDCSPQDPCNGEGTLEDAYWRAEPGVLGAASERATRSGARDHESH